MIVEMIAREVREDASDKIETGNAVLVGGMAAYFH